MTLSIFSWIIDLCWLGLLAYLIAAARGVKPDARACPGQSVGLLIAVLVAFALPSLPVFHVLHTASADPVVRGVGVALCGAGIGILVWGRRHLGRNWSQTVTTKEGHELVTSGPYRYIRHPIYAGGLLACAGSVLGGGGVWIVPLIILGAIFLWRVGAEDALMARMFPEDYPAYKHRTKALIPFVW